MRSTPERAFSALLSAAPGAPFVTYYNGLSGERSELSARSCANWVAKTYYLLRDELGLGVGDTATVALPAHWISVPVLLGCWYAGLSVDAGNTGADVAFVTPDTAVSLAATGPPAGEVYAIAPDQAARGFGAQPPPGTQDFLTAVRPQADAWGGVRAVAGPDEEAIPGLSRAEVVTAASGLPTGTRLLLTRGWARPADWVQTLVAAVVAGGSLVIAHAVDDPARIAAQERTTA